MDKILLYTHRGILTDENLGSLGNLAFLLREDDKFSTANLSKGTPSFRLITNKVLQTRAKGYLHTSVVFIQPNIIYI